MLLERTIHQLDIGWITRDQAETLGQLGYLQWLGALPGDVCYATEAALAHERARPFMQTSPAIQVFCDLLRTSLAAPARPLPLHPLRRRRRGGAAARRALL